MQSYKVRAFILVVSEGGVFGRVPQVLEALLCKLEIVLESDLDGTR